MIDKVIDKRPNVVISRVEKVSARNYEWNFGGQMWSTVNH